MRILRILALTLSFFAVHAHSSAQSEVAPALLSLQPQQSQCLQFNSNGTCAQQQLAPTGIEGTNAQSLVCIAFNLDGSCALYQRAVSSTLATTSTAVVAPNIVAPTTTIVAPISAKTLPPQTITVPTRQIVRTVVQPAPITSTFGSTPELIQALLVPDYVLWHAGPGRFNWDGQEYGGRKTAYSLKGWRAGFIAERGQLFASGNISHYTEDKTFHYAAGTLTINRLSDAGPFTNSSAATMITENQHNAFDGTIALRSPLAAGITTHVGIFGRVDDGNYSIVTTESAPLALNSANSTLNEFMDSVYFGPRAGITVVRDLRPNWRVRATASGGPAWVRHAYAFNQTIGASAVDGRLVVQTWGMIADGRLGFEHHMGGNMSVSFGAFGTYNSHGPRIDRPTPTDTGATTLSTQLAYELGADIGLVIGF